MSKKINKGGRPHLAPELKRNKRVTVNFTASEYKSLANKAKRLKMPLNDFLRASINKTEIKEAPEVLPDFLRHLANMGNNLNQIAHHMNIYGVENDKLFDNYTNVLKNIYTTIEDIKIKFLED